MLGIDLVLRQMHEAHVLLVKKTPSLEEMRQAEKSLVTALRALRLGNGMVALGIYQFAPEPPPPGTPLFGPNGEPAPGADVSVPGSSDGYTHRMRMACAREILAILDELTEVPAVELQDQLSVNYDREKIVKPVLRRMAEEGIIISSGNTRGAVYSLPPAPCDPEQ